MQGRIGGVDEQEGLTLLRAVEFENTWCLEKHLRLALRQHLLRRLDLSQNALPVQRRNPP
jgi:hypothetical protein